MCVNLLNPNQFEIEYLNLCSNTKYHASIADDLNLKQMHNRKCFLIQKTYIFINVICCRVPHLMCIIVGSSSHN